MTSLLSTDEAGDDGEGDDAAEEADARGFDEELQEDGAAFRADGFADFAQEPALFLARRLDARGVADFQLDGAARIPAETAEHFPGRDDDLVIEAHLAELFQHADDFERLAARADFLSSRSYTAERN